MANIAFKYSSLNANTRIWVFSFVREKGKNMIENVEELKQQINIVDIISHYLPLKKSGGNYTACCPFHTEDTASFMVSPAKQIYHCFGCLVGGDSIKFVMELQKIGYIEAIKEIANIVGFNLIYKSGKIDTSLQSNEKFLDYIVSQREHVINIALNRGISENVINEFCIGYGGEDFEIRNLYEDKKEALQSGILFETNNGYKSMFAKRLIIPIFNANGKCVAFSGRSLDSKQNPKYINSKQTKLYNKSKILFGYDKAKKHIAKEKSVYIVEGYFDVLALHTMGIKNSVGICGTALSKEHIALLTKYDDVSINLALDNDNAGKAATLKAISLFIQYELYNSFVLCIDTKEKDFNDILLRDKEIFTDLKTQDKRVKKIPIIAYVLQDIHKRLQQGNSIENKAKILKQVSLFLNSIKDSYIRLEYNKYANKLFGFNISHIKTIPNNNTSYNPNIISYNLTMARVLKAAYNNREYKEILRQNTNPSYFHPLEQSYIDCMQDKLNHTLAHIVFNDEYVMGYRSLNEFIADLNDIIKYARDRERKRYLRSNADIQDKVNYLKSL